jgi:hypothetical protein
MVLSDSIRATVTATASGPSLADWLTAGGTVLLALITAITLIATVRITKADRRHDTKIRAEDRAEAKKVLDGEHARAEHDRADAAQRLDEERELARQRLQDERDHAEKTRRRERQADNAYMLIQRIAAVLPYLDNVPGTWIRRDRQAGGRAPGVRYLGEEECRAAVDTLRQGAWAETIMLGRDHAADEAAARYRCLAKLIESLARSQQAAKPERERDVRTVRNYARWVRISLGMLAEDGSVPQIHGGSAQSPLLGLADMPAWLPDPLPPGWLDEQDEESRVRATEANVATPVTERAAADGDT